MDLGLHVIVCNDFLICLSRDGKGFAVKSVTKPTFHKYGHSNDFRIHVHAFVVSGHISRLLAPWRVETRLKVKGFSRVT